jgi:hypothetical protein
MFSLVSSMCSACATVPTSHKRRLDHFTHATPPTDQARHLRPCQWQFSGAEVSLHDSHTTWRDEGDLKAVLLSYSLRRVHREKELLSNLWYLYYAGIQFSAYNSGLHRLEATLSLLVSCRWRLQPLFVLFFDYARRYWLMHRSVYCLS